MTYPGKLPPKFELSNSSHVRKAEESFAMHTIVQTEWSGGTACVQSECAHALRPKFGLSNSSHARKAEESFAMHTIVQSEWCPAAPHAKFPSTFPKFWPTAKISTPLPHPLFSLTKSHISPVSSFLPSLLRYSRSLTLTVSHPTIGVAMVFFKDISSGYAFLLSVGLWLGMKDFLLGGQFESFLPLVAP